MSPQTTQTISSSGNAPHAAPLLAHYDLSGVSSTIAPDQTGNGFAGVIRGCDRGGAFLDTDQVFGRRLPVLRLTGNAEGGYLQLPDGVLNGADGVTVSFYCRIDAVAEYGNLFSFGRDHCFYLSVLPGDDDGSHVFLSPGATAGGRSQEACLQEWIPVPLGRWFHMAVSFGNGLPAPIALSIDGEKKGGLTHRRMEARALEGCTDNYFGFGAFALAPLGASFADIRIFGGVLDKEEMASLFHIEPQERLRMETQNLAPLFDGPLEKPIALPESGQLGAEIAWRSLTPDVISDEGQFDRPTAGSRALTGKMEAVLSFGGDSLTVTFACEIPPLPEDADIAEADAAAVALLFPGHVTEDMALPETGAAGSAFRWASSHPRWMDDHGHVLSKPAGNAVELTLTLTSTYGAASVTREFPIRILPDACRSLPQREYIPAAPLQTDASLRKTASLHAEDSLQKVASLQARDSLQKDASLRAGDSLQKDAPLQAEIPLQKGVTVKEDALSSEDSTPEGIVLPSFQAAPAPMEDIRLSAGSIFYENQERCLNYLRLLDADRMLYNFRKAFGVSTKDAMPLGGWEEPSGLLRGHSTGHFLSALAYAYASTEEDAFREKAEYMIHELLQLQETALGDPAAFRTACSPSNAVQSLWSRTPGSWGKGFLSAYSPDQFALLEEFTPYATIWAPYYTLHKILAGLIDCHLLLHSDEALSCARGIGDWVCRRLSGTTKEQREKMWKMYIAGEYGGMNESLSRLYEITGNRDYLETAQMFDNVSLFQGLAHGRDTITGIHANQHIPQIIGAMEEFQATGDPHYYHLARNFWELVVNRYMYSIGGVGRGENFREPGLLAKNIEGDRNCETCATYNMLKLSGLLYRYAPEHSEYMDYYERAMANHIAASQNPVVRKGAHHGVTYMLPIGPGARKQYGNDYDDFTCCHGTGMENHIRYTEHIYHHGPEDTLYVNLFLPSVYDWKEKGARLAMESPFPSEECRLTVHALKDAAETAQTGSESTAKAVSENTEAGNGAGIPMRLKIRIPYWCRDTFRIQVNGEELPAVEKGAKYYLLERSFADGDCVTITMPYSLHLCYTEDPHEGYPAASLMYGPLVMTALSDRTDWIRLNLPSVLEDAFDIRWEDGMPELWYDNLRFVPSYAAQNVAYHTYFQINPA